MHGGGPQIAAMLNKLRDLVRLREWAAGHRQADRRGGRDGPLGLLNKDIVSAINRQGGKAVGISGKDANLMIARKITEMADPGSSNLMKAVDIGYVGDPSRSIRTSST